MKKQSYQQQIAQQSKGLLNPHLYNPNEPVLVGYDGYGKPIYEKPAPAPIQLNTWSPLYSFFPTYSK